MLRSVPANPGRSFRLFGREAGDDYGDDVRIDADGAAAAVWFGAPTASACIVKRTVTVR